MENQTLTLILVAAAILIAAGLVAWFTIRRRHTQELQEKFGPEYDYALEKLGNQRAAEETLQEREKRVNKLEIRDLEPHEKERYHREWIEIEAAFVDDPSQSVEEANRLITEVMIARGFPVADFEQRAADISVVYPDLVPGYRNAYAIALKNQNDRASTEELRQAMMLYSSVVEELLGEDVNRPSNKEEAVPERAF